jgi:NADH:ubiquinone reductase (H+-translocating)
MTVTSTDTRQQSPAARRVVVVGAGFAGLATLKRLRKAGFQVTLIDHNLYTTFQPLLYQVATGGINPGDVSYPAGGFARKYGARYSRGELAGIDAANQRITLTDGRETGYDYLIVATGVSASYFGIKGAEEHTYGLYTRADAVALRDRFMADIEQLSTGPPGGELAITMAGGGATGVELAGTMAELRDTVLRETFPDVDPARVHVRLVEMLPELLTPFHPKLRGYTRRQLEARGVEVCTETAIDEVTPDQVRLKNGQELRSDLTVWTAGVAAPPAAKGWGLPQGRAGRIVTGPDLRVKGQDRILAIGDIALIEDHPTPQLSQPALQMGRHAAEQIRRLEAGQPTEPFSYHDKGQAATIGRRSAVIELAHGPDFRGTLAWLGWLALHLFYLLGGRNRISALVNLAWRYMTWGHGASVIVGDVPPAREPGGLPAQAGPGELPAQAEPGGKPADRASSPAGQWAGDRAGSPAPPPGGSSP